MSFVTNDRSRPIALANDASDISAALIQSRSFMLESVPQRHRACQALCRTDSRRRPSGARQLGMTGTDEAPPKRGRVFLREWREFRELTQEAAADRVDVDRTTLSKIERGILPYNQDFLERLALAYGCEPAELLGINPLQPDPPKLVYARLRAAPPDVQRRAVAVLEALLKTG